MNRKITLILSVCLFLIYKQTSAAAYIAGGEILYRNIGGLKYEITVKIYRDCRGSSLDSIRSEMTAGKSLVKYLTLTRVSIKDITSYCSKSSNPCGKANSSSAGFGIEEHIFKDTVDFNTGYDTIFKKYCYINVGAGYCCRTGSITTGGANSTIWVNSSFDICKAPINNSPIPFNPPLHYLCCNQTVFTYNDAFDSDMDSLSYTLDEPLCIWGTKMSWNYGFDYTKPITVYYPSGYDKSKGPNPNGNPPIGFYFDGESGESVFTPVDCKESTPIKIKISEWRKNKNGKYENIGEISREVVFNIISCTGNNIPTISNKASRFMICENEKLCFDIFTTDKTFVPPTGTPKPDTLSLTWNNPINGSKISIVDTTARLKQAQFCWTPPSNSANDIPYTFNVKANDNFCDLSGIATRTFYIKVKKRAKAKLQVTSYKKGRYQVQAELDSNFNGSPSYFWEILDSNFNLSFDYYFYSNMKVYSNKNLDTLIFSKGGKYYVHLRISNPPLNCANQYYDTLIVPPVKPFLLISPNEIVEKTVCRNTSDSLIPVLTNAVYPVRYRWSTSPADTLPFINPKIVKDTVFRVDVYDSDSFHRWAIWNYHVHGEPKVDAGSDVLTCKGDTAYLRAKAFNYKDTVFWKWHYEGKIISDNPKCKVVEPGTYTIEIKDSNNCLKVYDSLLVSNQKVIVYAGSDQYKCPSDTFLFSASGLDTTNKKTGKYYWYNKTINDPPISSINTVKYISTGSGKLIVKLLQTVYKGITCMALDTVNFIYRSIPEVKLKDASACQNQEEVSLMDIIQMPVYSKKGTIKWYMSTSLKKPNGKALKTEDLIYDESADNINNYNMKIGKSLINLGIKFSDIINLKFSYIDTFGCKSLVSDSIKFTVKNNFDIEFINSELKMCFGDSIKKLSDEVGVNLYGGRWVTNNDSSYYKKWEIGNKITLPEKINTNNLNKTGGKYLMTYTIDYNNCISQKNARLNIIPIPEIAWSQTTSTDSVTLSDNSLYAPNRFWFVNSKMISKEKQIAISKTDAKTKKILLKAYNELCEADSIIKPLVTWKISGFSKNSGFEIFPNPAENTLYIKSETNQIFSFTIFNELSQKISHGISDKSIAEIDLSTYKSGIYSVLIKSDEKIFSFRFMKN